MNKVKITAVYKNTRLASCAFWYRIGEYFVAALLVAFASLRDARLSEPLFPTARVLRPNR